MEFNIKSEIKKDPFRVVSLVLLAGILIYLIYTGIFTSNESKFLKRAIIENKQKLKDLEGKKDPLIKEILSDSLEIVKKDSIILKISRERDLLLRTLNYFKNENKNLKNTYINAPLDERIFKFSKLATEKDSIR